MPIKKTKHNTKELDKIVKTIEKKKGINIEIFNVGEVSSVTDYFIISTALSMTHLKTLRDEVIQNNQFLKKPSIDGRPESGWIVLDYGGYIVHLMVEEERNYYNLEEIWGGIAKAVYHA